MSTIGNILQATILWRTGARACDVSCPAGYSPRSEKQGHAVHTPVTLKVHSVSVVSHQVQTHKPYTVAFDLADPGAVVAAAVEILQHFGCVDVLLNNAGISYRGAIVDTATDVDKKVMDTNYFGPVALTKGNGSGVKESRALLCWHPFYFTWFLFS